MKLPSTAFLSFGPLLAAALLTDGAPSVQAQPVPASGIVYGLVSPVIDPVILTKVPALTGTVGALTFKTNTAGTVLHVKGSVSISNVGTKGAKNVTATVYLSNDAKFDTTDTKVATASLADYNDGNGTLGKGKTLSLTFKRGFPKALAAGLTGKYLLVFLSEDKGANLTPIVVGPIQLP